MERKRMLAALTALILISPVLPADSQERTNPQSVETYIEESLNRNRPMDVPVMENPRLENWTKYFNNGEAARKAGNFPAALQAYDRALSLNPNAYDVYLARAATFDKMGMYQRAIENFDIAIAMHPRQEKVWLQRSDFFIRQGKLPQTLRDLDEGIRYLPDSVNLHMARGTLLMHGEAYAKALKDFDDALIVQPNLMPALINKATCENHLKQPGAFEATLSQILAIDSKRVAAWVQRARLRQKAQRLQEADSDYTHALYADPKDLDARIGRGLLRMHLGLADPQMCSSGLNDLRLACKAGDANSCKLVRKPTCMPAKPAASSRPQKPAPSAQPTAQPTAQPQTSAPSQAPPSTAADQAKGFPEIPPDSSAPTTSTIKP